MSVDSMANGWAKALSIDRKQFNMFFDKMMDGFAYHKIVVDNAGKPVDYVFLEVNSAFERMTGLKKEKIIGKKVTEVLKGIENDPADWIGVYGRVALTCESVEFENFAQPLGKWFKISAYCPEKGYFITLFEDITERKKAAEKIVRIATIPELNPNSIIEVDFDCKVQYANPAAKATFPDALDSPHHPLFADWKQVIDTLQSKERQSFSRELRIGESTFYQTFYLVPNAQLVRFYMVNIDELKRAENALRESEHRWATTVSSIGDAVITTDLSGNVTFLNRVAEDLTGWNSTEALRKPLTEIFNIINAQTRSKVDNPVTRVLKEGKVVGLANHTILMRKNGTPVPIDDSGAPIRDKDGSVTGVVLVFRDITERKKAEEVIAQQAFMIANANDAIIGYSFDQKVTFWNKAAEQLYGYKAEEALGQGGADLLKPNYVNISREELIHRLMTSGHMEAESVRQTKDGRKLDAEVHVILLRDEMGKPIGYVSVDRDITERKKAERDLWQAKNDWERTFNSVPDFIAILDNQHKIVRANQAMAKQLGVTPEQAIGLSCYTCVHGTSLPPEFCPHSKTVQDGKEHVAEVHEPRLGGDFLVSTTPLKDEKGRMIGSVHVARDITERKKAEEALKKINDELEERVRKRTAEVSAERQRLYNVLEALPAYVVLLDKNYCVPFANKVFRERFGESHGRPCYDFLFSRKEPCENCETYKVLKTNAPHHWEWTGPDRRDYDIYDFPFVEADGSTLILEMGIDITERKRAEEKLQAVSLYSRSLIEASLDPLVTINAEGKITDVNKATEEATGCPREQMINSDFSDYFTEPNKARAGYQQVFTEGFVRDYPLAIRHTTGKVTDVLYNATLFRNEVGDIQGVFAAARDVTAKKQAEEKLRAASLYARSLIEASLDPLVTISAEGKITDVNRATENATGCSRQELIGSDFSDYFTEPEKARAGYTKVFNEGYVLDYPLALRHKSGKIMEVLYNATVYKNETGEVQGVFAAARDVTERKRAEKELKKYQEHLEEMVKERTAELQESEQRFAKAFHSSPASMAISRLPDEMWVDVNESFLRLYDYSRKEIVGHNYTELNLFDRKQSTRAELFNTIRRQGSVSNIELGARTKSGKHLRLLFSGVLVNLNGQDHIISTQIDITERKKAEVAIKRQAELIDLSPDGIIVRKPDGTITFWSKGAEKLYGWTTQEAIGEITHQLLKTKFSKPIDEILLQLQESQFWSGELIHQTKDGRALVVQSYWSAYFDNQGNMTEVFESNVDITERATLQEKLEESAIRVEEYANQMEQLARERLEKLKDAERLAAIGQTAGMVGHDIRNPLQSILSELYLAKTELPGITKKDIRNSLTESIANIENDINYINKIVQDLQDFAKPIKPAAKETNLETLCKEVLSKTSIPQNIKVSFQVDEDAAQLIADPDLLKRIMANLVTNAVQAMPEGGKLDIRAYQEKDNTIITVKDTGVGIPEDVKPKLFTPLFTTKSKGQGFGLAVVKRMTEAIGGKVSFESEVGKGTKFIVTLPRSKN